MLTSELINKLTKLGFPKDVSLERLLNEIPEGIWITAEKKHLKKKPAQLLIKKSGGMWDVSLSVSGSNNQEIYVLERILHKYLDVAVAKMLLFLDREQLLNPEI